MHKEVMRLQDKLEKRDQEIVKLNKELAELKEESTKRWVWLQRWVGVATEVGVAIELGMAA